MSYVLIDNSTLTSVQRLLGEIEISNKNIIEGDILATENLIQSILFYDNIIAIDDYKDEHKLERKKRFDFLRFLSPEDFGFEDLKLHSQAEAKKFQPEIRGGEFVDEDFSHMLQQLKLNMITTWDISSSEYYLNLKLLGYKEDSDYEKYNQIASAIYAEIFDRDGKADYRHKIIDSYGNPIQKGYFVPNAKWSNGGKTNDNLLARHMYTFIASLNWIAYKSIYYTNVAKYLNADLFLHPIRQSFNIHYMNKIEQFDDNLMANLINDLTNHSLDTINIIKKSMNPTIESLQLPFFSFWLIKETKDSKHIIEKAFEIRNRQSFIDAREQLAELNHLVYDEEDLMLFAQKSKKIKNHVYSTIDSIKSTYSISTGQGINLNNVVKVINAGLGINIPDIFDKKIPLPEYLTKKPRGLGMVYRDITEDLSKISRFGVYRDLLSSNVLLKSKEDDHRYDLELKVEDPIFRYSSSMYKSPM